MEALADVELMWHERIEQKGVEKGIQQGIQQGKQQGLQQGKQEMILRLLRQKFGHVPEVVVQKVQVIDDVDILEQLFDQALMADSLAEIEILA
jgi:predicted transposase YdaD